MFYFSFYAFFYDIVGHSFKIARSSAKRQRVRHPDLLFVQERINSLLSFVSKFRNLRMGPLEHMEYGTNAGSYHLIISCSYKFFVNYEFSLLRFILYNLPFTSMTLFLRHYVVINIIYRNYCPFRALNSLLLQHLKCYFSGY